MIAATLRLPRRALVQFLCQLVLLQVLSQRFVVFLEHQHIERPQQVVPVDRFPPLPGAFVACLAGDERDELAHALLHDIPGVFGDFRIGWDGAFHDPADVGDGQVPVLLSGGGGLCGHSLGHRRRGRRFAGHGRALAVARHLVSIS